jgi:hypothetical protein
MRANSVSETYGGISTHTGSIGNDALDALHGRPDLH